MERWAEAHMVLKLHGEGAAAYVAERVRTLASAGDEAGVSRWLEIAARMDQLTQPGSVQ